MTGYVWKPEVGDLVAVPELLANIPGVIPFSKYAIIVATSKSRNYIEVFYEGETKVLDSLRVTPMWSEKGVWLQTGKSET